MVGAAFQLVCLVYFLTRRGRGYGDHAGRVDAFYCRWASWGAWADCRVIRTLKRPVASRTSSCSSPSAPGAHSHLQVCAHAHAQSRRQSLKQVLEIRPSCPAWAVAVEEF